MIHDGAEPTNLDRIALSAALYTLAERFETEAARWRSPRGELRRNARTLAHVARGVLSDRYDAHQATAYLDAGTRLLARATAFRNLITAIYITAPKGHRA